MAEVDRKWEPPSRNEPRCKKVYTQTRCAAIANGELVNFYQPKVAVATGEVVGVETLVRWRHPRDGMVFPDQFIGVAEAHGLIDDLTRVVLPALAQARFGQAGLALRVAVNPWTTFQWTSRICRDRGRGGVPPQRMVLEVTETRLMEDLRTPLEILTRLRLKRFRLSIDDFGIVNSSLAQLRDLPFDELKIDQSFVHGACCNEKLKAMFDSSLGLAKQLGMEAVAEGVEDQADWDFVRKAGCDIAQGYFIAKPMPAADLPAWIQSWQKAYPASHRRI